jgi:hypothetical protein
VVSQESTPLQAGPFVIRLRPAGYVGCKFSVTSSIVSISDYCAATRWERWDIEVLEWVREDRRRGPGDVAASRHNKKK